MLSVYEVDLKPYKALVISNGEEQVIVSDRSLNYLDSIPVNHVGSTPTGKLIHTVKDPVVLEEGKAYHAEDITPKPGMLVKQVATGQLYIYQIAEMDGAGDYQSKDTWVNVVGRFMLPELPGTKYKILDPGEQ